MAAKRTSSKKKAQQQGYAVEAMLEVAHKSGSALKVSTAEAEGKYPVNIGLTNGTSVVMTACFLIAAGFKNVAEVATDKIATALDAVVQPGSKEANVLDVLLKKYQKAKGKEYKNFENVRARIKKQIRRGGIVSFVAVDNDKLLPQLAKQLG